MVISEKCCRIYFRKRGQWSQKLKERKRCLWRNPCPWETDSQEHYVLTGFSWAESSALGQTGGASAGRRGGRLSELCIRAAPATASGSSSCERCGEEGGRWEKAADGYGQTGAVPGPHQESSFHASAVLRGCCLVFLDNSKKRLLSRLKTSFFVFQKTAGNVVFSENGTDERLGLHQPQKYARSSFLCNRVSGCIPFFGIQ